MKFDVMGFGYYQNQRSIIKKLGTFFYFVESWQKMHLLLASSLRLENEMKYQVLNVHRLFSHFKKIQIKILNR